MSKLGKLFTQRVLDVVRLIPSGSTMTYQQVACLAGSPYAYRAVGTIMKNNKDNTVPCHRVVGAHSLGDYNQGALYKEKRLLEEHAITTHTAQAGSGTTKASPCWVNPHVLLVDKPIGVTSFDVVAYARRLLHEKKIGHGGTLDPFASGLLVLGITRAGTKQLEELLKGSKVYYAEVLLGIATTTLDPEGEVSRQIPVSDICFDDNVLCEALQKVIGVHFVEPPIFSAIKVQGRPLYAYARNNESVVIPKKRMEVFDVWDISIKYNDQGYPLVSFTCEVSGGTYIRTLGALYGELLGIPAHVLSLRRLAVGSYRVENAHTLNQDDIKTRRGKSGILAQQ